MTMQHDLTFEIGIKIKPIRQYELAICSLSGWCSNKILQILLEQYILLFSLLVCVLRAESW